MLIANCTLRALAHTCLVVSPLASLRWRTAVAVSHDLQYSYVVYQRVNTHFSVVCMVCLHAAFTPTQANRQLEEVAHSIHRHYQRVGVV